MGFWAFILVGEPYLDAGAGLREYSVPASRSGFMVALAFPFPFRGEVGSGSGEEGTEDRGDSSLTRLSAAFNVSMGSGFRSSRSGMAASFLTPKLDDDGCSILIRFDRLGVDIKEEAAVSTSSSLTPLDSPGRSSSVNRVTAVLNSLLRPTLRLLDPACAGKRGLAGVRRDIGVITRENGFQTRRIVGAVSGCSDREGTTTNLP